MLLLSIGHGKNDRSLYDKFIELCNAFKKNQINIAIVENDVGDMHYIKCILRDIEKDISNFGKRKEAFYLYASDIIYDFILKNYEREIIVKIMENEYDLFEVTDKQQIIEKTMNILAGKEVYYSDENFDVSNIKNRILKKLEEYFSETNDIILEGFIRFRLKNMYNEAKEVIDRVIEDYVIEREYSEFIKLLKYFLEIQETCYEKVDIFIDNEGNYRIEDGNGNNIEQDFFDGFSKEMIKDEYARHDVLISALITSAPEKVSIHGIENSKSEDVIKTIKDLYDNNLSICRGCNKCQKNKQLTKL